MNRLYHELISLYNALNDGFLNDLKHYSIENYSIDLYEAIKRYAAIEDKAIEYSNNQYPGLSWGELFEIESYFRSYGKRYGLLSEFRENAIC